MKHAQTKMSITALLVSMLLVSSTFLSAAVPPASADTAASISINSGLRWTNSTTVTLTLSASGAVDMHFSNDALPWSNWEPYSTQKTWTLTDTDANKTVYVEFRDASNQTSPASAWIVVDRTAPFPYPVIDWVSEDFKTVLFDASLSQGDWGISSYQWTFGDGNQGTGEMTTHIYANPGTYVATLTVVAPSGNSAQTSFNVKVPDVAALQNSQTPTPTTQTTPHPTIHYTAPPTQAPTPTPAPEDNSATLLIVVAAVAVTGVVLLAVVLFFWRRWSTAPTLPKPA